MRLRHLFILILFLAIGVPWSAHAETLAAMEAISARFRTMDDFLKDEKAVQEYREALKLYMGEGNGFDPVYAEFIRQIQEVNTKVKGFSEKAWRLNEGWEKEFLHLEGEYTGTGLKLKREDFLTKLAEIRASTGDAKDTAKLPTQKEISARAEELREVYGLLPEADVAALTGAKKKSYLARLGGDRSKSIPPIAQHPAAIFLSQAVAHTVLAHNENLNDALHSGDSDITVAALRDLNRLQGSEDALRASKLSLPSEILKPLRFTHPKMEEVIAAYEKGMENTKEFRAIADVRLDPALLHRIQELQAQGVPEWHIAQKLNSDERTKFEKWAKENQKIRGQKTNLAERHQQENPFFFYEMIEDPARGTLRLKSDGGVQLQFFQSPRAFHAFFAGRKTGECVGGRDAAGLTPKRWARAALDGALSFFTETGDGKMEGMIGITRLVNEKTHMAYDVVDLMSRTIKGDVIARDQTGKRIKFSYFDYFVDRFPSLKGSRGLVISDGNNVSQNVGGSEVVLFAPSYLEDKVVGAPHDFAPADPMAKAIAEHFPKTMLNYGGGGMIYDGMRGDGTKVVHLVSKDQRRKWTKEELEDEIYTRLLSGDSIDDKDIIWKRAFDNGITLGSSQSYKELLTAPNSPIVAKRVAPILHNLKNHPGSKEAAAAASRWMTYAESNPGIEDLFNPELVRALEKNVIAHPYSDAAHAAAVAIATVLKTKGPEKISPALMQAVRRDLLPTRMQGMQDWILRRRGSEANQVVLNSLFISYPDNREAREILHGLLAGRGRKEHVQDAAQILLTAVTMEKGNKVQVKDFLPELTKIILSQPKSPAAKFASSAIAQDAAKNPTETAFLNPQLLDYIEKLDNGDIYDLFKTHPTFEKIFNIILKRLEAGGTNRMEATKRLVGMQDLIVKLPVEQRRALVRLAPLLLEKMPERYYHEATTQYLDMMLGREFLPEGPGAFLTKIVEKAALDHGWRDFLMKPVQTAIAHFPQHPGLQEMFPALIRNLDVNLSQMVQALNPLATAERNFYWHHLLNEIHSRLDRNRIDVFPALYRAARHDSLKHSSDLSDPRLLKQILNLMSSEPNEYGSAFELLKLFIEQRRWPRLPDALLGQLGTMFQSSRDPMLPMSRRFPLEILEIALAHYPEDSRLRDPNWVKIVKQATGSKTREPRQYAFNVLGELISLEPHNHSLIAPDLLAAVAAETDREGKKYLTRALITHPNSEAVYQAAKRSWYYPEILADVFPQLPHETKLREDVLELLRDPSREKTPVGLRILALSIQRNPREPSFLDPVFRAEIDKLLKEPVLYDGRLGRGIKDDVLLWVITEAVLAHPDSKEYQNILHEMITGKHEVGFGFHALEEIAKRNPALLLRSSLFDLIKENWPRETLAQALLTPEHRETLEQLVRSGEVPFVDETLAQHVRPHLPPDAGLENCSDFYHRLYLEVVAPRRAR